MVLADSVTHPGGASRAWDDQDQRAFAAFFNDGKPRTDRQVLSYFRELLFRKSAVG